ncbi:c-type cytochrome, methanol metabolism-related [Palleronia marisminoris]|uniref:Cytochrome c-553I n=1 Tax=Palleronia marisminoris TaxID=315423 RepID=A0A1Y5SBC3_9RHOB|nr:c-type cytochrome, methanol metabolism-related [Palleronia marisminoris]SFG71974.1 c-type cytochrome, methanol metabolism-related [Palleronia marisminoris]SLN36831.1 Cytochrome c-553I precursor [Palleronia marisminoris]
MMLKHAIRGVVLAACTAGFASAQAADPTAVENDAGKYFDAEGYPTFNIAEDGTVDFHTYSGFRRFNSECHVCHGPDGVGSTFAPALVESVQDMSYEDFVAVVAGGRENVGSGNQNVMPAFGTNPNIMCYLDDIYIYLRARGEGDLPRGRPAKKEAKSDVFAEMEDSCMG